MAKKKKNEKNREVAASSETAAATPPKKRAPRLAAGASKQPAPRRARRAAPVARTVQPADEEIRLRAYFIAERRQKLGWAGDSHRDWIEAEQQLIAEAGRAARAKKSGPTTP